MKSPILLMASFGVALIATPIQLACAKDAPKAAAVPAHAAEGNLPAVKYDGKNAVKLGYGDLTVTLDSERGSDPNSRIPVFTGRYRDEVVFSLRIEEAEAEEPKTEARVMRLDPKSSVPQVVMTAFTGGAHCCVVTRIATITAPDEWRRVDARPARRRGLPVRRHRQ